MSTPYNTANSAQDVPYTIYHSGVVSLPVADSYLSSNINTVYDNIDHLGSADSNATTVDVNTTKYANGKDIVNHLFYGRAVLFSGFTFLGKYTNINKVMLTADVSSGTDVSAGVLFFYKYDLEERLKSTSTSRWSMVCFDKDNCRVSDKVIAGEKSTGVNIIDVGSNTVLDFYNSATDPSILGDNINDSRLM
jgi:hypothetical protein